MKVFAAWSGNSSKRIAQILRKWLPKVLPFVDVWMSEEDIAKGTRWSVELWNNLREADFGILCLVPGNVAAHWTIFEAGALSGGRAYDRVSPFLLGIQPSDLPVPLRQFQCTSFQNKDVLSLVSRLNKLTNDERLSEQVLEKSFQKHWPRLRDRLKKIDLTHSEKEETGDASKDADQLGQGREVLATMHKAWFDGTEPLVHAYFFTIVNLSEREIEVTHVGMECGGEYIDASQPERPLPKRLKPQESWATWIELEKLPTWIHDDPIRHGRVRLSTGQVIKTKRAKNIPPRGSVPGGELRPEYSNPPPHARTHRSENRLSRMPNSPYA